MWVVPSSARGSPFRLMLGLTLRTPTVWLARLLRALSESLTRTLTSELAGPSGKVQSRLPPVAVVVVRPTWLPLAPQSVLTTLKVSPSASVTVKA